MSNNLTLYQLLKTQVEAGAIVYEIDLFLPASGDAWRIATTPNPITGEQPYKELLVMGWYFFPYVWEEARKKGVMMIPMVVFDMAEREHEREVMEERRKEYEQRNREV